MPAHELLISPPFPSPFAFSYQRADIPASRGIFLLHLSAQLCSTPILCAATIGSKPILRLRPRIGCICQLQTPLITALQAAQNEADGNQAISPPAALTLVLFFFFPSSSGTTPTFCLLLIGFPRRQCPINCGLLCASALLPAEGQVSTGGEAFCNVVHSA